MSGGGLRHRPLSKRTPKRASPHDGRYVYVRVSVAAFVAGRKCGPPSVFLSRVVGTWSYPKAAFTHQRQFISFASLFTVVFKPGEQNMLCSTRYLLPAAKWPSCWPVDSALCIAPGPVFPSFCTIWQWNVQFLFFFNAVADLRTLDDFIPLKSLP